MPPSDETHLMTATDGAAALAPQPRPDIIPAEVEPEPVVIDAPEAAPQAALPALPEEITPAGRTPEPPAPPAKVVRRARRKARAEEAAEQDLAERTTAAAPPAAPKVPRKVRRQERKLRRLLDHLGEVEGETVLAQIDGTAGFHPVTLLVTSFRVAIVPHSSRVPARWIPLEEVSKIWHRTGGSNVRIDATIEVLRMGARRAHKLGEAIAVLREAVKEARSGNDTRHDAGLVQIWCDRTAELSENDWLRVKVWVKHHPKVKLLALTPAMPVLAVVLQRVI